MKGCVHYSGVISEIEILWHLGQVSITENNSPSRLGHRSLMSDSLPSPPSPTSPPKRPLLPLLQCPKHQISYKEELENTGVFVFLNKDTSFSKKEKKEKKLGNKILKFTSIEK